MTNPIYRNNIAKHDRQLILIAINLTNLLLSHQEFHPERFNDQVFVRVFELAQKFDKVFQDSLAPGKELNHE
jgi:hypothetical protein